MMADRTPVSNRSHARTPEIQEADLSASSVSDSDTKKVTRVRIKQIKRSHEQSGHDLDETRSQHSKLKFIREWSAQQLKQCEQSKLNNPSGLTSTAPTLSSYKDLFELKQFVLKELKQAGHDESLYSILAESAHSSPLIDQCLDLAPISMDYLGYYQILRALDDLGSIPFIETNPAYSKFFEQVNLLESRIIDLKKNIYKILVQALHNYLNQHDGEKTYVEGPTKNFELTRKTLQDFLKLTRIALGLEIGELDKDKILKISVFTREIIRYLPSEQKPLITSFVRILRNHV
jgi:hypothetical protein